MEDHRLRYGKSARKKTYGKFFNTSKRKLVICRKPNDPNTKRTRKLSQREQIHRIILEQGMMDEISILTILWHYKQKDGGNWKDIINFWKAYHKEYLLLAGLN